MLSPSWGRLMTGGKFEVMAFISQVIVSCVMDPCSPVDGWKPACQWEVVSGFLALLYLCTWLLLSLSNCLYLHPWVFLLLSFRFTSTSHQDWVSEQRCVAELPAEVETRQALNEGWTFQTLTLVINEVDKVKNKIYIQFAFVSNFRLLE